ncbi:MAG: hypothetical protein JXR31_09005 [Prolixibacteraceae bacterium]|nr:hypothetical protein [Prolixibacteraceae bacterium]MBN2774371.1 hypothetical protein [Prolixibacteraceae bacterium]
MNILFAFALGADGLFEKKHFGDAGKYSIYKFDGKNIVWEKEIINIAKETIHDDMHGLREKADIIISEMLSEGVHVLVSRQFGKNIKFVNQHFIPVIISRNTIEEVKSILLNQINWIKDELINRNSGYMLFKIDKGVLKIKVN